MGASAAGWNASWDVEPSARTTVASRSGAVHGSWAIPGRHNQTVGCETLSGGSPAVTVVDGDRVGVGLPACPLPLQAARAVTVATTSTPKRLMLLL